MTDTNRIVDITIILLVIIWNNNLFNKKINNMTKNIELQILELR